MTSPRSELKLVAGVDEVGRGPLAGPVVTAAVILPAQYSLPGLTDSKRVSPAQRDVLAVQIREQATCYAVAQASREEIDELNILQATLRAMQRAVMRLECTPAHVYVDGNKAPVLPMPSECVIGGDGKIDCVSAASILAKVARDQMMAALALEYPHYGWEKNSGYPTQQHLRALEEYGVTPHHRRSYAPVARALQA